MPIATLKFKLPEEHREHYEAIKASEVFAVLDTIHQELLRPARKFGYSNPKLQEYLTGEHGAAIIDFVGLLEEEFFHILRDQNLSLND